VLCALPLLPVDRCELRVRKAPHWGARPRAEFHLDIHRSAREAHVPRDQSLSRRMSRRKVKVRSATPARISPYDRKVAERDQQPSPGNGRMAFVSCRVSWEPEVAEEHPGGGVGVRNAGTDRTEPALVGADAKGWSAVASTCERASRARQHRGKHTRQAHHEDSPHRHVRHYGCGKRSGPVVF